MEKLYVMESGRKRLAEEIECEYCQKKYMKSVRYIKRNIKNGHRNVCSVECGRKANNKQEEIECCQCN